LTGKEQSVATSFADARNEVSPQSICPLESVTRQGGLQWTFINYYANIYHRITMTQKAFFLKSKGASFSAGLK
jgi:hypothetical protein